MIFRIFAANLTGVQSLLKYVSHPTPVMCETLDAIHEEQLASVIARIRKQKVRSENPQIITC